MFKGVTSEAYRRVARTEDLQTSFVLSCSTKIGYNPLRERMDLYLSSPECLTRGIRQLELLFTQHRHTPPDRDAFVEVFWNNDVSGSYGICFIEFKSYMGMV
jgi:hypothetical protein